jgi:integral membrane protein
VPVEPSGDVTATPTPPPGPVPGGPGPGSSAAGAAGAGTVPPKIMAAFKRYRVAAYIVGWGLLILCAAMVLKYAFGIDRAVAIWGPIHGALFVGYVILAFDLAYKDRWSPLGTLWVLIAGTIPFVSFVAERQVERKVLTRQQALTGSKL